MAGHVFTFMGTAAGCGVPSFFCDCPACEEARANPALRRGDCGVMVRGVDSTGAVRPGTTLAIDTPPDARHQLLRENVRNVDELLFTHGHFDHIGGLGEYEYLVQLVRKAPLPTYASAECLTTLGTEFHYMAYCLDAHVLQPGDAHEFDGVRYTALPVTHCPGTFGYLIETPSDAAAGHAGTRLFYASDTGRLPAETAERLQGVDVLAMDATFWRRNWNPDAHHSIQECIEEGLDLGAKKIYLTHMCLHYDEPITVAELTDWLAQYDGRVEPAMDGLSFAI